MRYHLFQKFFGKMIKIKETSFLSTRGMILIFGNCSTIHDESGSVCTCRFENLMLPLVKIILQKKTFRGHSKSAFIAMGGRGTVPKTSNLLNKLGSFLQLNL